MLLLYYLKAVTVILFNINVEYIYCHTEQSLVLLVSFDGFRYDYLSLAKLSNRSTPNFDYLIQNGVTLSEPGLLNSFTTQTFPNHYTLVTGMFEENHGVVANDMFDSSNNRTFSIKNKEDVQDPFWFSNGTVEKDDNYAGPQPIWYRNEMNGLGRSGVMFWPGSEAPVNGHFPLHYVPFNPSLLNETRVNNIVDWFSTEDKPINLGLVYFNEPDRTGHSVGPNHPQMLDVIEGLDKLVGYFIDRLKETQLFDKINMIITSDHGMTDQRYAIDVDKYVDLNSCRVIGYGRPVWHIYPMKGKLEDIYTGLSKIEHLHVYRKPDIPRSYHYTYNRRIPPIVVESDEGYILCRNRTFGDCPTLPKGGVHGYNNSLKSMHPFFIAHGPSFKKGYVAAPFRNVDVYPLMCHLLEIKPPENIDGLLTNVRDILFSDEAIFEITAITFLLSVSFVTLIGGTCCIAACRIYRIQHIRIRTTKLAVPLRNIIVEGQAPLLSSSGLNSSDDEFG